MQKDIKPSKELQEMREEEVTAEPSLDGLMPDLDLTDPRTKSFFAAILAKSRANREPPKTDKYLETTVETKPSTSWDPNAPETEEDAMGVNDLRRLKVRRQLEAQLARTPKK